MAGSYGQSSGMLEFRKPAKIFCLLGWLAAGPGNPAGFFVHLLWGMPEFNYQIWGWHIAAPLELGILFALFFLREGGYGVAAISIFTIFSVLGACAVTGPVYALLTWYFQQNGEALGLLGWYPVYSFEAAVAVSGTYMRASLIFAAPCIIPAIIIMRVIIFQRAPVKKRETTFASSLPF